MRRQVRHPLFFCDSRVIILGVLFGIMFSSLILKFYKLQIVNHNESIHQVAKATMKEIEEEGARGCIYDRYGELLATNKTTYDVVYDWTNYENINILNEMLAEFCHLLQTHEETYKDDLPISLEAPFNYTGSSSALRRLINELPCKDEKSRELLNEYSADELITYLQKIYKIESQYTRNRVRQIVGLRNKLSTCAYKQYEEVILAENVSLATVTAIKEQGSRYSGLTIRTSEVRYYPKGEAFSHLLGYTKQMTDVQYKTLKHLGYDFDDVVGQMGIEKSMDYLLRGKEGYERFNINGKGQKVETISEESAVMGKDIRLSIDSDFQTCTYESINKWLKSALIDRLQLSSEADNSLSGEEVLSALIKCGNLPINTLENESETSYSKKLYNLLEQEMNGVDELIRPHYTMNELLLDWIKAGRINTLLLALDEQEVIQLNDKEKEILISNHKIDLRALWIRELEQNIISPYQMNIMPYSAAAICVDIHTGEVLSMASYPSYDNNAITSCFDMYWPTICNDPRGLLWDHVNKTLKAPGSIFKMITAAAALEEGVITKDTKIIDEGIFKRAGKPYPKCWAYSELEEGKKGHGTLNLQKAIAVSCNYFFYELVTRLSENNIDSKSRIDTLTHYVEQFGLGKKTGIEVDEVMPNVSSPTILLNEAVEVLFNRISSGIEDEERIAYLKHRLATGIYRREIEETGKEEVVEAFKNVADIEIAFERQLETLLQKRLCSDYDELIKWSYDEMSTFMSQTDIYKEELKKRLLAEEDTTKYYEIATQYLYELLDQNLGQSLQCKVAEKIDASLEEEILDLYEESYTKTYRKAIRIDRKKGITSKETDFLRTQMKAVMQNKNEIKINILLKMRQNMLNAIVNDLLNGVELDWSDGITVRTAIGQGNNAFTPAQIARYIAALANGQEVPKLTLIAGEPIEEKVPLDISQETLSIIYKGMTDVVADEDGTAHEIFGDYEIPICAKTGTAQEGQHEHSLFTAFAPSNHPEVAIVVAIYHADHLGGYSQLIAKDMLDYYFRLDDQNGSFSLGNTWKE